MPVSPSKVAMCPTQHSAQNLSVAYGIGNAVPHRSKQAVLLGPSVTRSYEQPVAHSRAALAGTSDFVFQSPPAVTQECVDPLLLFLPFGRPQAVLQGVLRGVSLATLSPRPRRPLPRLPAPDCLCLLRPPFRCPTIRHRDAPKVRLIGLDFFHVRETAARFRC